LASRASPLRQRASTVGRLSCVAIHKGSVAAELKKNPAFRNKRRPERVEPAGNTIQRHATTQADEGSLHSFHFFCADGPRDMSIGTRGVFIAFPFLPLSDLSSRVVDLVAPGKAKEKKKKAEPRIVSGRNHPPSRSPVIAPSATNEIWINRFHRQGNQKMKRNGRSGRGVCRRLASRRSLGLYVDDLFISLVVQQLHSSVALVI
jgi:hypothetical protein